MKSVIYLVILITISSIYGCKFGSKEKSDQSKNTWDVESFELKRGKNLNPDDWGCSTIGEDVICIPSKWHPHPVKQDNVYYFSYLDNSDKNTYFAIVRYDITKDQINAMEYRKEAYSQMLKDTVEKFTGYTIKELIFRDKKTYYGEYTFPH